MSDMTDDIGYLSQEIGPRPAGTEEEQKASEYIAKRLRSTTGLKTEIEEFSCNSQPGVVEAICFGLAVLFTIIGMLAPQVSVLAFAITAVSCALYLCEVFDKPVLSRFFARGISQNVITRYKPVTKGGARPRKVIIVANYDSDKVRNELSPGLMGAYPILVKASYAAIIALPVLWLIRAVAAVTTGTAAVVFNVIFIILCLAAILPVIAFAMHRTATFNEGANSNASGVAAMMEIARRVSDAQTIKEEPEAEGEEPVVHGAEAAYEAGAVPEGVPVQYDVEPNTAATQSGAYEPALGDVVPREVAPTQAPVDVSRETSREAPAAEPVRLAQAAPAAPERPTPERISAQRAETTNVFTGEQPFAAQPAPEAVSEPAEEPAPAEEPQQAPAVPDWYKAAQERAKAKKGNARPVHPVRRSRYADALDAAVRESHAHFEEANKAVQREAQQYRETFQQGIREVAAPENADQLPPAQPREPKPIVRPVEAPVAPVREAAPAAQPTAREQEPQPVAPVTAPENRFERAAQKQAPAVPAYAAPGATAPSAPVAPAPAPQPAAPAPQPATPTYAPAAEAAAAPQQQPVASVPEEPVVETFIEDVSRETTDGQGLPKMKPYVETFDQAGIAELESAEAAQVIERPARQARPASAQTAPTPASAAVQPAPVATETAAVPSVAAPADLEAASAPAPQPAAPAPDTTAPVAPIAPEAQPQRTSVATATINDGRVMVDGPHDMDQFVQTGEGKQAQAQPALYGEEDGGFDDYYQEGEPEESRFRETTQRWKKRASGAFSSLRSRMKQMRDERKQLPEAYPDYEEEFTTAQIGEVTERPVDQNDAQATSPFDAVKPTADQRAAETVTPRTTNRVDVTVPRETPEQAPAAQRDRQEHRQLLVDDTPLKAEDLSAQTPATQVPAAPAPAVPEPTASAPEQKKPAAERVIVTATEADQPQRQSRESTISMPPIDVSQLREQVQTGTLDLQSEDDTATSDSHGYPQAPIDAVSYADADTQEAPYGDDAYAGYDDATYGDYDYYEDEPTRFDNLKSRAGGLFHRMRDSFDSARDKISDRASNHEGAHSARNDDTYVDGAYDDAMSQPEDTVSYEEEAYAYTDDQGTTAYAEGYTVSEDDDAAYESEEKDVQAPIDAQPVAVENEYAEPAADEAEATPAASAPAAESAPAGDDAPELEAPAPAARAERPKPTYRSNPNRARIDIPSVITVPDPADLSDANKQPAPLAAETDRDGETAAKTLLRQRIPRVALDGTGPVSNDKIEMDNKKAALRNTLSSMSGSITAAPVVDPFENNQRVSLSGSFSAVGNTGSFKPVGDELVEGMSPEEMYIDDADDSAYAAASPETGAYTPSQVVDMPKKHRGLFGRRHAGKHSGKRAEEQSASEWLNVDENFNPTEVGKARGGWESFQEDSAYEQQARASQQKGATDAAPDAWEENEDAWKKRDRWNGGAFSRARAAATEQANRMTHRGKGDGNAPAEEEPVRRPRTAEELPPEFSEVAKLANRMARDDGSQRADLAREEQQIYEFRDADVNVEVWFVALGSECSGDAGMKTFLQTHADELRGSIVINLDSVGAGRLSYLEHEGKVRKTKISTRMKRYLRMAVQATGIDVAASSCDWRDTPASVAARHGLQAVTIAGMEGAKPAYMGQGDDVLENIDESNLERTVDYVMNVVKNI